MSSLFIGHCPPCVYIPSVYLMAPHVTRSPRPSPTVFHTGSDQVLVVGTAWEQGYTCSVFVVMSIRYCFVSGATCRIPRMLLFLLTFVYPLLFFLHTHTHTHTHPHTHTSTHIYTHTHTHAHTHTHTHTHTHRVSGASVQ